MSQVTRGPAKASAEASNPKQPEPTPSQAGSGTAAKDTTPQPPSKDDYRAYILPGMSVVVAIIGFLALIGLLFLLLCGKSVHVQSLGGALGGGNWKYELSAGAAMLIIILACTIALVGLGYESVVSQPDSPKETQGDIKKGHKK